MSDPVPSDAALQAAADAIHALGCACGGRSGPSSPAMYWARAALAAGMRVELEALADKIEAERVPMPDTDSTAALTGWVMADTVRTEFTKFLRAAAGGTP